MAVFIICNTSPFTHSTPPHELQTSLPHHAVRFQENIPRFQENIPRFQEKVPRFQEKVPRFRENIPRFRENLRRLRENLRRLRENLRRLRERVRHPKRHSTFRNVLRHGFPHNWHFFLHSKEKSPFSTTFSLQYLQSQHTFLRAQGAISVSKCLNLQDKVYNNVLREFINGNISHHSR